MTGASVDRIAFRAHADPSALGRETAAAVARHLENVLAQQPRATLVVPGGTTPAPFFDALSEETIDWRRIGVTLSDERWVDVASAASNQRQARLRLLRGKASAAEFLSWRGAGVDRVSAAASLEASLELRTPFDACVLGLGADGHIASLIPGAEGFEDAMRGAALVRSVRAPAAAGTADRLSLTFATIAASKLVVLLFTGAQKRAVFDRAMRGEGAEPVVRLLRETLCPVWACWAPEAGP